MKAQTGDGVNFQCDYRQNLPRMKAYIMVSVELSDKNLYTTNPSFTSIDVVTEFTRPLKLIQLDYFTFDRHYNDHSRIALTNSGDWIKHYWQKKLYESANFERDTLNFSNGYVFWNWLKREPVYSEAAIYGIDNGITIIEKHDNYCDFFHFGSIDKNTVNNDYLIRKLPDIHYFVSLFKYKMHALIGTAEKYKIHVPSLYDKTHGIKEADLNNEIATSEFYNLFNKRDVARIYLGKEYENTYLTKKEYELTTMLAHGFLSSDVANKLNISIDTINKHIKNIKNKLNCKTLCELGFVIGKLSNKNIYPFSIER